MTKGTAASRNTNEHTYDDKSRSSLELGFDSWSSWFVTQITKYANNKNTMSSFVTVRCRWAKNVYLVKFNLINIMLMLMISSYQLNDWH
jgi:hypothetical protein